MVTILAENIDDLDIAYNAALKTISLPYIRNEASDFGVVHNDELIRISASLASADTLTIEYNRRLRTLSFPNLTSSRVMRLSDNLLDVLDDTAMPALETIYLDMRVEGNQGLRHITGFNSLMTVHRNVRISENPLLSSIEGFQKLETVNEIRISGDGIVDISGFKSLRRVGSALNVVCKNCKGLMFPSLTQLANTTCAITTFYCENLEPCACLEVHNRKAREAAFVPSTTTIGPIPQPAAGSGRTSALVAVLVVVAIVIAAVVIVTVLRGRASKSKQQATIKQAINTELNKALRALRQQHPRASTTATSPGVYDV